MDVARSTTARWRLRTKCSIVISCCLPLLITACEWNIQRREAAIPQFITELNDAFLNALGNGDPIAAGKMMTQQALNDAGRTQLAEFSANFQSHRNLRITRGAYTTSNILGLKHHRLTSQISTGSTFYLVALEFREVQGAVEVQGIQFGQSPLDLERLNRFTFEDRPAMYLIAVLIGLTVAAFMLWAALDCWRMKPTFWFIWIPAIVIGFPEFTMNWTSGTWDVAFNTVVPFGVNLIQVSRIHPPVLQIGSPLVALAWWIARTRADLAQGDHELHAESAEDPQPDAGQSST